MWEILVSLLILAAVGAAVRRRRRRRPLVVLPVNTSLTVGTLASETVVMSDAIGISSDFYAISADLTWSMRDHTGGEGPIAVGLTCNNYSVTEVKEKLNAAPTGPSDFVAAEKARRKVRFVADFPGLNTEETLNDGKPIRTKLKINLGGNNDIACFAFNKSGASLTTGTIIRAEGQIYGRWT